MSDKPFRVFVAGHRGMVGSAICRALAGDESVELVTRSRSELDLRNGPQVHQFLADETIDRVYMAAAIAGGIQANKSLPADFILQNLQIQNAMVSAAYTAGVSRLLFLGSSCIYPRDAAQPMAEDALLTGPLELTNEPYAVAKIAGIKLCESFRRQHGCDFRSVMPTNLYGPNDNFDLTTSHVLAALLRKAHEAKVTGHPSLTVWGSGRSRREFLHVDDLAAACVHILELPEELYWSSVTPQQSHINIGWGEDLTIKELALLCLSIVGCDVKLEFDTSKPDGTPRKLLDISKVRALGWEPSIGLEDGVRATYFWMKDHWGEITRQVTK